MLPQGNDGQGVDVVPHGLPSEMDADASLEPLALAHDREKNMTKEPASQRVGMGATTQHLHKE